MYHYWNEHNPRTCKVEKSKIREREGSLVWSSTLIDRSPGLELTLVYNNLGASTNNNNKINDFKFLTRESILLGLKVTENFWTSEEKDPGRNDTSTGIDPDVSTWAEIRLSCERSNGQNWWVVEPGDESGRKLKHWGLRLIENVFEL